MNTFSNPAATEPECPLTDAGQAALQDEVLHCLGTMPFESGTRISRILWLVFICQRGAQTRMILPIDDELGRPDPDHIAGLCELVARLMGRPRDGETALVVLRRPESALISDADRYVFRVMREANGRPPDHALGLLRGRTSGGAGADRT